MTPHVLDAVAGRPATGVVVVLGAADGSGRHPVAEGRTGDDGRVGDLRPADVEADTYRVRFDTGGCFAARGTAASSPEVVVPSTLADPSAHHHVPLLLSPIAFSTYRGT